MVARRFTSAGNLFREELMDLFVNETKEFLESIPQFIRDLEPGNEFTAVPDYHILMFPQDFTVLESFNSFVVSGFMAPDVSDLSLLPTWDASSTDPENYYQFLDANPRFKKPFNLKEFCDKFEDFYLDFLNDAGIPEEAVTITESKLTIDNNFCLDTLAANDANE